MKNSNLEHGVNVWAHVFLSPLIFKWCWNAAAPVFWVAAPHLFYWKSFAVVFGVQVLFPNILVRAYTSRNEP